MVNNGDVEATSSTSARKKRKKESQSAQFPKKQKKGRRAQQSEKQSKWCANVEAAQLQAKHYFEVKQDQKRDDLQQITYAEQTQLLNQTPEK